MKKLAHFGEPVFLAFRMLKFMIAIIEYMVYNLVFDS